MKPLSAFSDPRRRRLVDLIASAIGAAIVIFISFPVSRMEAAPHILDDTDALEFALHDDPMSLFSSLSKEHKELQATDRSHRWIRSIWYLAAIEAEGSHETGINRAVLDEAINLAFQLQAEREWVFLNIYKIQIELEKKSAPLSKISTAYEELLSRIDQLKDSALGVSVLTAYATQMLYGNDLPAALELIRRADDILNRTTNPRFFDSIAVRSAKADLLDFQNRKEEAVPIYRDVIAQLEARGARRLTSIKVQDLAITLLRTEDKKFHSEGFALIQKALALSLGLNDQLNAASCKMHIANYYAGISERQKAQTLSLEAVRLIESTRNEGWIGYLNWFRATIMLRIGNWTEALEYADKAIQHYSTEDLNNRINIHKIRYQAYKELKRYDKALENLEGYISGFREIAARNEDEQYNRAAAKLGLKLEQEKNLNLEKERQLQKQKLDQRNKESNLFRNFSIVLASLSLVTAGLLLRSIFQSKKLRKRKNEIQLILDSIDEGLFTIDRSRLIDNNVSKHLAEILGSKGNFIGKDFIPVLFEESDVSGETQSMVMEVLNASLGEDAIAWEMNEANLPREMQRKGRLLSLRWIPVFDSNRTMKRLLISVTDVTRERELEKAVGFHKRQIQSLPDILQSLLKLDPGLVENLIQQTNQILSKLEQHGPLPNLIQDLHTQKGVARSLGIRSLSETLHDLEGSIKKAQSGSYKPFDLLSDTKRIQENLNEYRAYADILKAKSSPSAGGHGALLSSAIEPFLPVWINQMNEVGLPMAAITIQDRYLNWNADRLAILRDICLHAINNCLDHGFRLPMARGLPVNLPEIEITAEQTSSALHIVVKDNGAGLDEHRVADLCRMKGLDPSVIGADVLFMDGVSTANQLTLTSGRGVGLSAIRFRVQELGGSVNIRNRQDSSGAQLMVKLPIDFALPSPIPASY